MAELPVFMGFWMLNRTGVPNKSDHVVPRVELDEPRRRLCNP